MTRPSRSTAIALAIILAASPITSIAPSAQGKSCGQIVDAYNRETQKFLADADQQNIDFLHNEIFKDYGETLRTAAGNSVDWDAVKEPYDELQNNYEMLNNIYLCTAQGSACLTSALKDKLTGAVKEWVEGLTESTGLNALRERVFGAMNLIQGYTNRVLGITTDTMTAMQQCVSPMRGQPRVALNEVPPVERVDAEGLPEVAEPTAKPIAPAPTPPEDGGGSDMLYWTVLGGGVGAAALYGYSKQQQDAACGPQPSLGETGQGSRVAALNEWCACRGLGPARNTASGFGCS